jgi:hypothetical protein
MKMTVFWDIVLCSPVETDQQGDALMMEQVSTSEM